VCYRVKGSVGLQEMASGPAVGRYGSGVTRLWRKAGRVPGPGAAGRLAAVGCPALGCGGLPLAVVLDPGPDLWPRLARSQARRVKEAQARLPASSREAKRLRRRAHRGPRRVDQMSRWLRWQGRARRRLDDAEMAVMMRKPQPA
jgi:hypothetical protein